MLPHMLLIASALAEELETALNLCSHRQKIRCPGVSVWTGVRGNKTLYLMKAGVGPARSAATLERVLAALHVTRILVAGYAGALDPGLKQGELVIGERADMLSNETWGAPLGEIGLSGSWPLADAAELCSLATAAGLRARCGAVLTSPCIIGAPEHKSILHLKHHACVVDMETAALARVATGASIPLSCVRAISDEAGDDFLAPFSYDPAAGKLQRAAKALASGSWGSRYSRWRERSLAARRNLSGFLVCYLDRGK